MEILFKLKDILEVYGIVSCKKLNALCKNFATFCVPKPILDPVMLYIPKMTRRGKAMKQL